VLSIPLIIFSSKISIYEQNNNGGIIGSAFVKSSKSCCHRCAPATLPIIKYYLQHNCLNP
ncbi:MAG TPA: hypothetical protein PKX60_08015, partial [Prolixibacteraceae bacterium]|nr:hypothetical protein [Prolixibacteraceae bacterium]